MCSQGSEQGKSFISVRLGHVTRIVIDGFDYQLQPRIDECALLGDRDPRATYIEPLMSAKSVVTILRCPSSEASGGSRTCPCRRAPRGAQRFSPFEGLCALDTELRLENSRCCRRDSGASIATLILRRISTAQDFHLRTSSSAWLPFRSRLTELVGFEPQAGTDPCQVVPPCSSGLRLLLVKSRFQSSRFASKIRTG